MVDDAAVVSSDDDEGKDGATGPIDGTDGKPGDRQDIEDGGLTSAPPDRAATDIDGGDPQDPRDAAELDRLIDGA